MEDLIVDSKNAAAALGITENNLRQLVRRKIITPIGRSNRKSLFKMEDVVALDNRKKASNSWIK